MKLCTVYPQGDFKADTWVKVYETTLTSAATFVTISSLTGNTAIDYMLSIRCVNGYDGAIIVYLYPNNDTTSANYGWQSLIGQDSSTLAQRSNASIRIGESDALGNMFWANTILCAKSGYVRTAINNQSYRITGTTVYTREITGQVWSNTADEITSLVITASQTDGLGAGTYICLYKRLDK